MREKSIMSRYHRISVFLILLLLFSTFVAVPHYHVDTADHDDCPICLVSNHQQATTQSAVAFDGVPWFTETTVVVSSPVFTENLFSFSRNNRAPPA